MKALLAMGTVVLALVVGACGGDDESSTSGSEAVKAPEGPKAATAIGEGEGEVNLIAWAGYVEDGSTDPKVDWVSDFELDTGCNVNVKIGNTSDEMVTLMRTGQYDGVSASGDATLRLIAAEGRGAVVYLCGHEGRGIGIAHKLRAYELQDAGLDTVDANLTLGFAADLRSYEMAATILRDLQVRSIRLMTNNPAKLDGLRKAGAIVSAQEPHWVAATSDHSQGYLEAKRARLGHLGGAKDGSNES